MASKFDLEIVGVVENMSGFTTPDGERFTIFGEGGGQLLADEIDVPLLGKVPLEEALRDAAPTRAGRWWPRTRTHPPPRRSATSRAGIVAATPQELPVFQAPAMAAAPGMGGKELPVIQ